MNLTEYTQRYTAAQVTSVDRRRLLLLVFEGGLRFLRAARAALAADDRERFGEQLARAQAIIAELLGTLDHAAGGTVAGDLARLYEFMLLHLTRANAERSVGYVDEVIAVFSTIADAFRQAIEAGAAPADAPPAA